MFTECPTTIWWKKHILTFLNYIKSAFIMYVSVVLLDFNPGLIFSSAFLAVNTWNVVYLNLFKAKFLIMEA